MSGMPRIVDVTAFGVRVPRRQELLPKTAHGEVTASEYAFIRVATDSGVRGVGEVTTAPGWNGEEAYGSIALVNRLLRERLIGKEVDDWQSIGREFDSAIKGRPFLRAGLEMACLDAEARVRAVRVVDLLGGVQQTRMENKIVLPARAAETVEQMARLVVARGAERIKVKVGTGWPGDTERLDAVRALHSGPLSVDANEGWDPKNREAIIALIERVGLDCIEQPFHRSEKEASRELQAGIAVPLLADESVWTDEDIRGIASARTFRSVSLYPGKLGGVRRFVRAVQTAEALGLGVVVGSNLELGVGTAAMAHALAATSQQATGIGHDLIGPLYFEHPLITDASFVAYDATTLPDGTGLGVEVDQDALHRFALEDLAHPDADGWTR